MSNIRLNDIFNGYDGADPVAESLNNEALEKLSKKNASEKGDKKPALPTTKKDGLIAIARKVEEAVNRDLPYDKKIRLDLTFTANMVNSSTESGKKGVFVQSKNNSGFVAMNINIKRISKLPAFEVYSIMYKSLYEHAMGKSLENQDGLEISESKNVDDNNKKVKKSSKEKAIDCLAAYLNKFLPKYFEDKFKRFDNISKLIATQIVNEMGEEDFEKILGAFFKFESLNEKAERLVEEFLNISENSRYEHILGKATELLLDPSKEVSGLSYMQQYEELMSVSTQNKFKEAVNGKSKSLENFKSFCVSYANRFMASNNLDNIMVTFDAEGELGTFFDTNPPRVNVNLEKINSISELVMTLSHELTHAVDSCKNRVKGNYNREGGGLEDSISEDISDSGLKTNDPAYRLLRELKNYCYHVNPNERHARIGELSALKFVDSMASEGSVMKGVDLNSQLAVSLQNYIRYQQRTSNMIAELSAAKISSWRAQMSSFGKLPISAQKMISERIDYLENMLNSGLLIDAEKDSIEVARKMLEEQKQKQEAKKAANQAVQTAENKQMGE